MCIYIYKYRHFKTPVLTGCFFGNLLVKKGIGNTFNMCYTIRNRNMFYSILFYIETFLFSKTVFYKYCFHLCFSSEQWLELTQWHLKLFFQF